MSGSRTGIGVRAEPSNEGEKAFSQWLRSLIPEGNESLLEALDETGTSFGEPEIDFGLAECEVLTSPSQDNLILSMSNQGDDLLELIQIRKDFWLHSFNIKDDSRSNQSIEAEVGDDFIFVGTPAKFATHLAILEVVLQLKISVLDTSINPNFGTFSEGLIVKPMSQYQTWHNTRKKGNFKRDLAYIDTPKLRTLIGARSTRIKNSETLEGRCTVLKNSLQHANQHLYQIYNICILFQCLNIGMNGEKPNFLPVCLGGLGAPVPWETVENLKNYFKVYKNGRYRPFLNLVVNEVNKFVGTILTNPWPKPSLLLVNLAKSEIQFRDWIKFRTIHVPNFKLSIPDNISATRMLRMSDLRPDQLGAVLRLISEREIVTEEQLEIAVEANEHIKLLQSPVNFTEALEELNKLRKEYIKNVSNWARVITGAFSQILYVPEDFNAFDDDIEYFLSLDGKLLRRIFLRDEWLFPKESLSELYQRGQMMVKIPIMPNTYTRIFPIHDWSDEVKYFIPALSDWFYHNRDKPPPKEAVDDDTVILKELETIPEASTVIIVTDDTKLMQRCHKKRLDLKLIRYPVLHYYAGWMNTEGLISEEYTCIMDTGSIAAGEETYYKDGLMVHETEHPFYWNKEPSREDFLRIKEFDPEKDLRKWPLFNDMISPFSERRRRHIPAEKPQR